MSMEGAVIAPDVREALARGGPVVALETSVFSQGLPYPQNLEAHRRMRSAVEHEGAVPAVVAVLQGVIRIGLVEEEIRHIGESKAPKLNTQNLALALASGGDGALTVSATAAVNVTLLHPNVHPAPAPASVSIASAPSPPSFAPPCFTPCCFPAAGEAAAAAASIEGGRPRWMCPPTCPSWPGPRWRS